MGTQQEHSTSRAEALLLQQVMRECSGISQHPSPAHVGPIMSLSLAPCGQGCTACGALELSQSCTGAQLPCGACFCMGCAAKMWGTLARGLHSHGVCLHVKYICMICMACIWGTLACGARCSHVGQAHTRGALPACGMHSCVGCTARAQGMLPYVVRCSRVGQASKRGTPLARRVCCWHVGRCATSWDSDSAQSCYATVSCPWGTFSQGRWKIPT